MRKSIYFLIIICLSLFAVCTFIMYGYPSNNLASVSSEFGTSQIASTSLPSLLLIPKINIEAKIEDVGVTKDGNMATPQYSMDVGWYEYGTLPGDVGNAVIAGHLDNFFGLPAVFAKLSLLSVGDDIYIVNKKGEKIHFQVKAISTYDYDAKDTSAIFGFTDKSHLNLITCEGRWLKGARSYNKRLVIFTELM